MNEAFWLMWKALTPILAVTVTVLLFERRQQQRRAESLWRSIEAYRSERADLVVKLAEAQVDAAEAKSIANILRHRDEATCPCNAVTAADEHIAYLTERNNRLTLALLGNGVDLLTKISRNRN